VGAEISGRLGGGGEARLLDVCALGVGYSSGLGGCLVGKVILSRLGEGASGAGLHAS
jgi:hypothetical protein